MKVKKLVKKLKHNTCIVFYKKSNEELVFATYDSRYLLRNYPMDHDAYCIMNSKIITIESKHMNNIDYLNIIIKE